MQTSHFSAPVKRSAFLDLYRGLAVLLMIAFHFCWDLRNFGFIDFSIYDPFWVYFRRVILVLFLSAVGWSTYVALTKNSAASFWKRDVKLLICTLIISVATYLAMPTQWIYFGILHFIFSASILARPLTTRPITSALLGATVVVVYQSTTWLHFPHAFSTITHYLALPQRTLDIVFPFPWIGVVFIGPLLGYLNWHTFATPDNRLVHILAFMGRYALPIYLTHQLLLFALVGGFRMVLTLYL
ncbi:heparan-alpha-glucosaminide N-acetyltransferase [Marinomonas sp. IMCC 4694]|uniref:heparan-alpha-glucosaminide N-acetyltransferase n=1 Tax=Marinomonas sp. IMCC 4694 TaxID=2605432 RepID=UPI0011E60B5C|nr:heparan-alpha-glucosaminide N-acetyltransferase [Marinomonas sp. IMCC 4694]TYL48278.1 DUF1624 domain-containing protein [Marinomonas sp. IMCC 4694]